MNPYHGQGQYCRDVDPDSTMTKMEHTYWITKQTVLKKMGKKEDECIVASDAELDAKLELFHSIQESCQDLNKIVDRYQDRLCCVAQEENALGRFLKEASAADETAAGKMMNNVGRAISYGGKQRLGVRPALLRLCQEVETFRQRAVADTLANVRTMEKQRAEYRAALKWMKDVSQQLDPERQLDKFRKVQGQVRRSKARFDHSKLVCLQKIDLLAAARCNMFSHGLVLYHKTMLEFCDKAAHAFHVVANTCKGYQHYEFSVVKELAEPSLKLAEQLNGSESGQDQEPDKDILLFFDSEYHDENDQEKETESGEKEDILKSTGNSASFDRNEPANSTQPLLDLADNNDNMDNLFSGFSSGTEMKETEQHNLDLAGSMALLEGLFLAQTDDMLSKEWAEVFGGEASPAKMVPPKTDQQTAASAFCPSLLLDQPPLWAQHSIQPLAGSSKGDPVPAPFKSSKGSKGSDSKWLNLFADLDPLADPDSLGARTIIDRNC